MNLNTHKPESLGSFFRESEKSPTYWEELAILDFTEEVVARMAALGVNRSQLAERLKVEPAYVTKLIGGSNNFTLRTMVKISRALAAELRFHLQPKGAQSEWTDYTVERPRRPSVVPVPAPSAVNNEDFTPTTLPPVDAGTYENIPAAA